MILKWIRRRQVLIILICLIIIGVCLPVLFYAKASLPELIQRNTNDSHMLMLMLLVEMDAESGSNFIEAKKDYAYILGQHIARMEERPFSHFLSLLYPELSPRKQLTSALAALTKLTIQQDQAENEIKNARQIIARFVSNLQKSSGAQISRLKPEDLPEELLYDAETALDTSHEYVERYMAEPTISNAQEACRKNRMAIVMAYQIYHGYQELHSLDGRLRQFRGDLNRTIYYSDVLRANEKLPREEIILLENYSQSETQRLDIVNALLERDIQKAEALVRNTIGISGSQ